MRLRNTLKVALKSIGITKDHWLIQRIRKKSQNPLVERKNALVKNIGQDPLNASLHLEMAVLASTQGNPMLAYSELKTAQFLGLDKTQFEMYEEKFRAALPDKIEMNHNTYYRIKSIADEIRKKSGESACSVLDVGGGTGALAAFIPEHKYCLAEPRLNGISGTNLPFKDQSFDFVVSCHVLEHIPPDDRELFLDQLLSHASKGLILLNPFEDSKTQDTERLQLFIDIADADWAREHLDCSLPNVDDLRTYAAERGLQIEVRPNGTLTTTVALVFMTHFARLAGAKEDNLKVHKFFNQNYLEILDSEKCPTAHLVIMSRSIKQ